MAILEVTMLRIRLLKPSPTQVLVYDSLGLEFLQETITNEFSVKYLILQKSLPVVLRWSFFNDFLLNLVNCRFSLRLAYIISLIDQFRPQIVLTFADTSPVPGEYSSKRPETLVLSVQNALRDTPSLSNIRKAPVYYCFGQSTKQLFDTKNIPYQRMVIAGSLALGLFLSQKRIVRPSNDLVFVSSYRVVFEDFESSPTLYTRCQAKAHECIFRNLLRYSREHNLRLTVIAKAKVRKEGEHFTEEKSYFERLACGQPFDLSSTVKNTYNSYEVALSAEILVSLDSTLAYEMLSLGKKVLVGLGISETLSKERDFDLEYLPDEVLLSSKGYDHFKSKMNELNRLTDEVYQASIAECRSKYVSQNPDYPPHERIKDEFKRHLAGQTIHQ